MFKPGSCSGMAKAEVEIMGRVYVDSQEEVHAGFRWRRRWGMQ